MAHAARNADCPVLDVKVPRLFATLGLDRGDGCRYRVETPQKRRLNLFSLERRTLNHTDRLMN